MLKAARIRFERPGGTAFNHLPGNAPSAFGRAGVWALLLALGHAGYVGWEWARLRDDARNLQDAMHSAAVVRPSQPAVPPLTPQQRLAWNEIARRLNTPWSTLLDALEHATPDSVALLAIEPEPARGVVRVEAEAPTFGDLMTFTRALEAAPQFSAVLLRRHEKGEHDAARAVRMRMELRLAASVTKEAP